MDIPLPFIEKPDGTRKFDPDRDDHLAAEFVTSTIQLCLKSFDVLMHHATLEGLTPSEDEIDLHHELILAKNLTKKRETLGIHVMGTIASLPFPGESFPIAGVTPWGELLLKLGGFYATPTKLNEFRLWAFGIVKKGINEAGYRDLQELLEKNGAGDLGLDKFGGFNSSDPADWWKD